MGRLRGDIGPEATYAVAIIFLVMGLHLLGVIPMPFSGPGQIKMKRKGYIAAFMLGLIFGVALGPCTFGFMAPVLGASFEIANTNLPYALIIIIAFAIGHCAVIAIAGASANVVQRYLNWNERSRGAVILRGVCGVLVILGGLYLLYTAPAV